MLNTFCHPRSTTTSSDPFDIGLYGRGRWKFVFLQHGVTYDDLSRWLNGEPMHMMITSSCAEHEGIVGDRSPYPLSEKEVALTGLPRHDRLLAKADAIPESAQRLVLVMPTWRDYLLEAPTGGHARQQKRGSPTRSTCGSGTSSFLTSLARCHRGGSAEALLRPSPQPSVSCPRLWRPAARGSGPLHRVRHPRGDCSRARHR